MEVLSRKQMAQYRFDGFENSKRPDEEEFDCDDDDQAIKYQVTLITFGVVNQKAWRSIVEFSFLETFEPLTKFLLGRDHQRTIENPLATFMQEYITKTIDSSKKSETYNQVVQCTVQKGSSSEFEERTKACFDAFFADCSGEHKLYLFYTAYLFQYDTLLNDLSRRLAIPSTNGGPISAIITYFNYLSLLESEESDDDDTLESEERDDDDLSAEDDFDEEIEKSTYDTKQRTIPHQDHHRRTEIHDQNTQQSSFVPHSITNSAGLPHHTTNSICLCNACLSSGQRRSKITSRLRHKLEQRQLHSKNAQIFEKQTTIRDNIVAQEYIWNENPSHRSSDSVASTSKPSSSTSNSSSKSQRRKNKKNKQKQIRKKNKLKLENDRLHDLDNVDDTPSSHNIEHNIMEISDYDRMTMQIEIDQFAKDLQSNISFWSKQKQERSDARVFERYRNK